LNKQGLMLTVMAKSLPACKLAAAAAAARKGRGDGL
jgi:hypothetical protein